MQSAPITITNKTDRHDITAILVKVVLNTITPPILHARIILPVYAYISNHNHPSVSTSNLKSRVGIITDWFPINKYQKRTLRIRTTNQDNIH
jgi:hypothetical protein